jgi:excisionase family DNA binding protein
MSGASQRGYRIAEAAKYMGVSPWFVELKIRSRELPALKLCRHYTVLREDMDRFLDSQQGGLPLAIATSSDSLLLDLPAASSAAGLTVWQLRGLIANGELPVVKVGRKLYVRRAALVRWSERAEERHRS